MSICLYLMIKNNSVPQKNMVWWMKRSGHGDYASGDVAITGDKLSLHCVLNLKLINKSI